MRTALQISLREINRLIAQESYNCVCKEQLEKILAELQRIVAEVVLLEGEVDQHTVEIASLMARIEELEAENVIIRATLISLQEQINNIPGGGSDLEAEVRLLQQQMDQTNFIVTDFDSLDLAFATAGWFSGTLLFPAGTYEMTDNLYVDERMTVVFTADSKLESNNGYTLTIDGTISAPDKQIFQGDITVTGLNYSKLVWFAGDLVNQGVESAPAIRKALDSLNDCGTLQWVRGSLSTDGTILNRLDIDKGINIQGYGKDVSFYDFSDKLMNGFNVISDEVTIKDITLRRTEKLISGASNSNAINVMANNFELNNVVIDGSYVAVSLNEGTEKARLSNITLIDSERSGLYALGSIDTYLNNFDITTHLCIAILDPSSLIGNFEVDEYVDITLNGVTTGVGLVKYVKENNTAVTIYLESGLFFVGSNLEGVTSGALGNVVNLIDGHNSGGISLNGSTRGFVGTVGTVRGGRTALSSQRVTNPEILMPQSARFSDVLFDSSTYGVNLGDGVDFNFSGCTIGNSGGDGLIIRSFNYSTFIGCTFAKSYRSGVVVYNTAAYTVFSSCKMIGNNVANNTDDNGIGSGIQFTAGARQFTVTNCVLGGTLGASMQKYGLFIAEGNVDYFAVTENLGLTQNTIPGIEDRSTGVNKYVDHNY